MCIQEFGAEFDRYLNLGSAARGGGDGREREAAQFSVVTCELTLTLK